MHRAVASLIVLLTLALPRLAWACPVCGQGRDGSESAMLVMSGILSALPLLMAGGIVAWIVVRVRAASREHAPPAPEPPADGRPPATEAPAGE